MSAQKIDKILQARGITGLFLAAPKQERRPEAALRWERYATATGGFTWTTPQVDRVAPSHRHHIEIAYAELQSRGFQRIGFCLPEPALNRVDSNWLAGFFLCQHRLPERRRIPLFIGHPDATPLAKFRRWHDRWRPDAILCLNGVEHRWLQDLGLEPGPDIAFACLYHTDGSRFAGIDENSDIIGAMACDLISSQIIHNERGIPTHQRTILVEGRWVDGPSVPAKKKTRRPVKSP
jgi:LacI family transcriptional regulator